MKARCRPGPPSDGRSWDGHITCGMDPFPRRRPGISTLGSIKRPLGMAVFSGGMKLNDSRSGDLADRYAPDVREVG
jgi:hypothetical protein